MLIRRATTPDSEELTSIARAAKASWGYPQAWMAAWSSELMITPEYISNHLVWVAEVNSTPVGCVALEIDAAPPQLAHLWVHPGVQRQGVGIRLVRTALAEAAANGVEIVEVVSDPNAEPFYERIGGQRVGWVDASFADVDRRLPVLHLTVAD